MSQYQRRYSDEQRAAIQQGWYDRQIRPAARIAALAAAGELTLDGEPVPAFDCKPASARAIGERYERAVQRAAHDARKLGPADAVELFRRDLAGVIAGQIERMQKLQARRGHEKIRTADLVQLGRAIRELAAIPAPTAPPPKPISAKRPSSGRYADGKPAGGLADQLRASTAADTDVYTPAAIDEPSHLVNLDGGTGTGRDDGERPATSGTADEHETGSDGGDAGSYAADAIARIYGA